MFVNQPPVTAVEGQNSISYRAKMDLATRGACMDALTAIQNNDRGQAAMSLHLGAYQTALLQHNVVSWNGPAFQGVPCTAENIGQLDPDEPLVVRVLEDIAARNPLKTGTGRELANSKKGLTSAGGPRSKELPSEPANGIST